MYRDSAAITSNRSTLAHDIVRRAERHGERTAVSFTTGDGTFTERTYADLVGRAASFATFLRAARTPGQEQQFVLIVLPNGLDYVTSFYGCLLGGAVAVPFYPPSALNARTAAIFRDRLTQIMQDCHPSVVVLPAGLVDHVRAELEATGTAAGVVLIADGNLPTDNRSGDVLIHARPSDLALLQYTSGSTTRPKGVMVSHANLAHNSQALGASMQSAEGDSMTTWLPLFHDLGLIGTICHPLYAGMTVHLTTPSAFIRRPRLWLEMISRFRSTTTMAPNFAYDLCVRSISEAQRAELDLSCLRHAGNAAEPIRSSTLAEFSQAFASCGFDPHAFLPGYGMAEATLCITTFDHEGPPSILEVSAAKLREGAIVAPSGDEAVATLVSSGSDIASDSEAVIVDPVRVLTCPEGTVGEIWATGPSVAQGYWGHTELSERILAAALPDDGRRFLRTGDLGVKVDGLIYVTGRIKDVIIQRGVNHYPQDVEYTAEQAHPSMRPGGSAAFTVPTETGEQVVLLCELSSYGDPTSSSQILNAVRIAVAEQHGLDIPVVAIVRKGQIPKTTSGKVRRSATAQRWLDDGFDTVAIWPARPSRAEHVAVS